MWFVFLTIIKIMLVKTICRENGLYCEKLKMFSIKGVDIRFGMCGVPLISCGDITFVSEASSAEACPLFDVLLLAS
jgi:hypothetical protein